MRLLQKSLWLTLIGIVVFTSFFLARILVSDYLAANVLNPSGSKDDFINAQEIARENSDVKLMTGEAKDSNNKKISWWFFSNSKAENDLLVVYVYGIAGIDPPVLKQLTSKYNVFVTSAPGFNGSDDVANEVTYAETAGNAFQILASNSLFESFSKKILYSHSMGNYPAALYVKDHNVFLHVMAQPSDTANDVCKRTNPWYEKLLCSYADLKFNTSQYIAETKSPTCVISTDTDTLVPKESGDLVFSALPGDIPKYRILTQASKPLDMNGGHNNFPVIETLEQCISELRL